MRILAVAVAAMVLVGCSSNAIPLSQATQVPADKIYAFQVKPAGDSGKVTVLRDGGMFGSGCDMLIYFDGKRAAKLSTGQKASFYLPSGNTNIGVGYSESGICTGPAIRTIAATVSAGKERAYRISSDGTGFFIGPYVEY